MESTDATTNTKDVIEANSISTISPYRHSGMWVFDDEGKGLDKEPFVSGADAMIDRLVSGIPDAAAGFTTIFSAEPFPGCQANLVWRREEWGGNWYYCPQFDTEGWLCPALLKYFEEPPREIYVQAKAARAQHICYELPGNLAEMTDAEIDELAARVVAHERDAMKRPSGGE